MNKTYIIVICVILIIFYYNKESFASISMQQNDIRKGASMVEGQLIKSPNSNYLLYIYNGKLCLYNRSRQTIKYLTLNKSSNFTPCKLAYDLKNYLIIYDNNNNKLWQSKQLDDKLNILVVTDNGELALNNGSSNTMQILKL